MRWWRRKGEKIGYLRSLEMEERRGSGAQEAGTSGGSVTNLCFLMTLVRFYDVLYLPWKPGTDLYSFFFSRCLYCLELDAFGNIVFFYAPDALNCCCWTNFLFFSRVALCYLELASPVCLLRTFAYVASSIGRMLAYVAPYDEYSEGWVCFRKNCLWGLDLFGYAWYFWLCWPVMLGW